MKEQDLIALLKSDVPSAIKPLFNLYHARLCQVAYRVLKDHDQAKDTVQEVFIKIWNVRHDLQIHTSLEAYLKRATVNMALNHLAQRERLKKESLQEPFPQAFVMHTDANLLEINELAFLANKAIESLPHRTRTVFTLIRSEDMSYKEVSETLSISLKAVEKEMMKALKLLREALKSHLHLIALFVLGAI